MRFCILRIESMKSRTNEGIDLLRGIAAFGIVACHLNLLPMTAMAWKVRALCDMNVALFAALSGFLMWRSEGLPPMGVYAKKRCLRLLPVYAIWTAVFILFGFVFDLLVRHGINPKWQEPGYVLDVVFLGQASAHLWFVVCLFFGCKCLFLIDVKYLCSSNR